MSDLPSVAKFVTEEETDFRAPFSESMAQKMGESISYILDKLDTTPVGSIEGSLLDETDYQAERGVGWVLMDGRDITGSRLAEVTGLTDIPDARGMFLRGKNYTRPSGTGNPDGDLAVGTYQADENASHSHVFSFSLGAGNRPVASIDLTAGLQSDEDPDDNRLNVEETQGDFPLTIDNAGGDESRPKNTTLNWFIRIN